MAEEDCGNAVSSYLRPAYLLALGLGVRYPRPHTAPYHRQFQLAEYTRHLYIQLSNGAVLQCIHSQDDPEFLTAGNTFMHSAFSGTDESVPYGLKM